MRLQSAGTAHKELVVSQVLTIPPLGCLSRRFPVVEHVRTSDPLDAGANNVQHQISFHYRSAHRFGERGDRPATAVPAAYALKKQSCGHTCLYKLAKKQGGDCYALYQEWDHDVQIGEQLILDGASNEAIDSWLGAAKDAYDTGKEMGCNWAKRVKPPHSGGPQAPRPGGGAVGSSPSGGTGSPAGATGTRAPMPSGGTTGPSGANSDPSGGTTGTEAPTPSGTAGPWQ